jgi:hypothetical protein
MTEILQLQTYFKIYKCANATICIANYRIRFVCEKNSVQVTVKTRNIASLHVI